MNYPGGYLLFIIIFCSKWGWEEEKVVRSVFWHLSDISVDITGTPQSSFYRPREGQRLTSNEILDSECFKVIALIQLCSTLLSHIRIKKTLWETLRYFACFRVFETEQSRLQVYRKPQKFKLYYQCPESLNFLTKYLIHLCHMVWHKLWHWSWLRAICF